MLFRVVIEFGNDDFFGRDHHDLAVLPDGNGILRAFVPQKGLADGPTKRLVDRCAFDKRAGDSVWIRAVHLLAH